MIPLSSSERSLKTPPHSMHRLVSFNAPPAPQNAFIQSRGAGTMQFGAQTLDAVTSTLNGLRIEIPTFTLSNKSPPKSSPTRREILDSITSSHECLVTTAGILLVVQIQLLTAGSNATATVTQPLLTIAMISELVGVMIALYFQRFHRTPSGLPPFDPLPITVLVAANMPILFVFLGTFGLAAALVDNFYV